MKRFKEFIKKVTDPRKNHMSWGNDDVEHEPEENKNPRKNHMSWGNYDVVHDNDIDESVNEKMDSYSGGIKNIGSGKPSYWKPGRAGAGDEDIPLHRPQKDKSNYHSDHPDQIGLGFKEPKKNIDKNAFRPIKENNVHDDTHEHNDMAKSFEHHESTLSPPQKNAVVNYKGGSYDINRALRNKNTKKLSLEYRNDIKHLDHVTSGKTPHDMTVYRGIHDKAMLDHPVGHKFTDHGFTGTSLRKSVSADFSHDTKGSLFRIHVPKGSKAHYIDGAESSSLSHEREMLIHRGTKYKYMGKSKTETGRHVIDLHVVGQRKTKGE
jgi:hypothetical protein